MNKKALGKGLSAIISSTIPPEDLDKVIDKDRIINIDIKLVNSNPDQPRTSFDNDEINELAESIKAVGLIQPVIVREKGNEYFYENSTVVLKAMARMFKNKKGKVIEGK